MSTDRDHDAACPWRRLTVMARADCQFCPVLARARADERAKARVHNTGTSSPDACCECCYEVAQPLRKDDPLIGHIQRQYAADLRAKVKALPVVVVDLDPDPHGRPIERRAVLLSDVLALLEEKS